LFPRGSKKGEKWKSGFCVGVMRLVFYVSEVGLALLAILHRAWDDAT
jgi:hypothetical protein